MRVVWVDEGLHAEAWTRAAKEGRDGPSLVDWVSFLVMRRIGVERALALDAHFTRHGFRAFPERRPSCGGTRRLHSRALAR